MQYNDASGGGKSRASDQHRLRLILYKIAKKLTFPNKSVKIVVFLTYW